MSFVEIEDVRHGYIEIVSMVLNAGAIVAPRGQVTREMQGVTIIHRDPQRCLVHGINRKSNKAIAAAEALQLVGGVSMPELMTKIAPNFSKFLDGGAFYGAYGPRIRHQLPQVCKLLREDPLSRRAYVQIWRSDDLFVEGSNDYPCTIGFTFQIRDGKLDMHTHMRSNDVWLGFTYDVTQFCFLQMTIARMLGLPVGTYYHHVDSLHIYERDVAAARQLQHNGDNVDEIVHGIRTPSWQNVRRMSQAALDGDLDLIPQSNPTVVKFGEWIQDRIKA